MAKQKRERIRILRVKKGDSLKTIYAKAKRALTAEDIVKYTEPFEGIPARQLLAELEGLDRENAQKKKRKPKNGPSR